MRTLPVLVATLAVSTTAAADVSPLSRARAEIESGRLDDAFLTLQGQTFADADNAAAAALMAKASVASRAADDAFLALTFAQMALRLDEAQPLALEVAARVFLAQKQFAEAERHADRWMAASPRHADARLLRADIALEQGEWERAIDLASALSPARLKKEEASRRDAITARAQEELEKRNEGLAVLKEVESQALRGGGSATRHFDPGLPAGIPVILYSTTWCPTCTAARDWLNANGIPFVEKDVDKDSFAAREKDEKARKAGISTNAVPVLDVRGTVLLGLSPEKIRSALKQP